MRTCGLHGTELIPGKCQVRRGMPPAPPEGYLEASRSLFPNARSFEIGGCLVGGPDDRDEKRVKFCPDCREAETVWHAAREDNEFWRP